MKLYQRFRRSRLRSPCLNGVRPLSSDGTHRGQRPHSTLQDDLSSKVADWFRLNFAFESAKKKEEEARLIRKEARKKLVLYVKREVYGRADNSMAE